METVRNLIMPHNHILSDWKTSEVEVTYISTSNEEKEGKLTQTSMPQQESKESIPHEEASNSMLLSTADPTQTQTISSVEEQHLLRVNGTVHVLT